MKTFSFVISATGLDPNADDFEDRFFEAGCDDATIAFMRGLILLDFDRVANTLREAVQSALTDVSKAGARPIRVEPDNLVSMAEIAERLKVSRQTITNYVKGMRGARNFPIPRARATTDRPLWDWVEVAKWIQETSPSKRIQDALEAAQVIEEANNAISSSNHSATKISA